MTVNQQNIVEALEDAVRALRDIADLDPTRPAVNDPEKVARRSLTRISNLLDLDLDARGLTPRPGEAFIKDHLEVSA